MVAVLSGSERAAIEQLAARYYAPDEAASLIAEVADIFRCRPEDISSESRAAKLVDARTVVAAVLDSRGWTQTQIGDLLNRDYTTVCNMLTRASRMAEIRSLTRDLVKA